MPGLAVRTLGFGHRAVRLERRVVVERRNRYPGVLDRRVQRFARATRAQPGDRVALRRVAESLDQAGVLHGGPPHHIRPRVHVAAQARHGRGLRLAPLGTCATRRGRGVGRGRDRGRGRGLRSFRSRHLKKRARVVVPGTRRRDGTFKREHRAVARPTEEDTRRHVTAPHRRPRAGKPPSRARESVSCAEAMACFHVGARRFSRKSRLLPRAAAWPLFPRKSRIERCGSKLRERQGEIIEISGSISEITNSV